MDVPSADLAVHLSLIAVVVWAVLGNPAASKAIPDGGGLRFPVMLRAKIALVAAAAVLGWRAVEAHRAGETFLFPAVLAAVLLLSLAFMGEIVVDDKGIRKTRLFGKLESQPLKWKNVARAEVSVRRRGGRQRATIRVYEKGDTLAAVHGGALVDPQGFIEELGRRGVKVAEA